MRIGLLVLALLLAGCAKSVDEWRRDLRDRDPYVRLMAAVALGRSGQAEAAPELLGALSDPEEGVRAAALESLRQLGSRAVPALLTRLERNAATSTTASETRQVAAVLVDQGLDSSAPLIRALQDERYDREAIVAALGDAGSPAVEPLSELLLQFDPAVAAAAATALGNLAADASPAVAELVLALRSPEPQIVLAAANALARIGPDRNDTLHALLQVARAPAAQHPEDEAHREARAAACTAAVRGLLLRMASGQPPLQEQALAQTASLGMIALEGLVHALKFESDPIAAEAAACLATLGPQVLPLVLGSLGERNPVHIARAAQVVARMGPPALEPLLVILRDPSHRDRVRAVTAVVGLGPDAAPAWPLLLELLDDPQPQMPVATAYALGQLTPPDDSSLEALLSARSRKSALVGHLLLPAAVRGLLLQFPADDTAAAPVVARLRALGPEALDELGRLSGGGDAALAAAARRAAMLLAR